MLRLFFFARETSRLLLISLVLLQHLTSPRLALPCLPVSGYPPAAAAAEVSSAAANAFKQEVCVTVKQLPIIFAFSNLSILRVSLIAYSSVQNLSR